MSETGMPAAGGATSAPSPATTGTQAIREAVEQLRAALPKLRETNPAYADGLATFLQRADDPVRLNQAEFQHRIAYALKDVEKITGSLAFTNDAHRLHIYDLSTSAPGLNNQRVLELLTEANSSADTALRRDIRRTAIEVGKQADQNRPEIRSQIDAIDNRVRLSQSIAIAQPSNTPPSANAAGALGPGLDAAGQPVKPASLSSGHQDARQTAGMPPGEAVASASAVAIVASSLLRGFHKLGDLLFLSRLQ